MTNKIYDLTNKEQTFYKNNDLFAEILIKWIKKTYPQHVKGLVAYAKSTGWQLNKEETTLLLIQVMVLWESQSNNAATYLTLKDTLGEINKRNKGEWLAKVLDKEQHGNYQLSKDLNGFQKLIDWLAICDEYRHTTYWVKLVYDYFKTPNQDEIKPLLEGYDYFYQQAHEIYKPYVLGYQTFKKDHFKTYKNREDVLFTGKHIEEYYLNFVGAALLNKAYKDSFNKAPYHMLVLPACMKAGTNETCKVKQNNSLQRCKSCRTDCQIYQLKELMHKYKYDVRIVEHGSDLTTESTQLADQNLGIIGVACSLQLLEGGWMLRKMGIPAQCVVLNFSGCHHHWQNEHIVTGLFEEALIGILENK